jgi:hypothetical protein
MYQKQKMTSTP